MNNYKHTLNLPKTQFPMKGNLAKKETSILLKWEKQDVYSSIRRTKKGKKMFILHDGPPYANGDIHIGHSVNKILKDITIKSRGLMGYDAPYIPGWDCHGLPIELQVEQLIGKPGEKVSSANFRAFCRRYAYQQVEKQKKDFIRLGILGDWHRPYLTMNFSIEANTIRALGKVIANDHLYRGAKPIHWCIDCCSSLAESELEYYQQISPSVDVVFLAKDSLAVARKFGVMNFVHQVQIIVWTTTPWTLPANRAITVNPYVTYYLVEFEEKGYIIASSLSEKVMQRIHALNWSVIGKAQGKDLEKLLFFHPFMKFEIPVVLGNHVKLDVGTGIVHTAPGYGPDDYIIGQQYNLEIVNQISPDGRFLSGVLPLLDGVQVFQANHIVIDLLRNNKALLHIEEWQHSVAHCWRHKTPTIFRTTPQWFISMDQKGLREKLLFAVKQVKWIPSQVQNRILNMIANRPDWCISRQRTWGVPMSLFIHKKTETLHPRTMEIMEVVAKKVEKEGIEAWWSLDVSEILGDETSEYYKVLDTLDVWFDSGATYYSVIEKNPQYKGCKPDMYLEGLDQYRGWFMSSLIISLAAHNSRPYDQVLTHGFTVDAKGYKMSKSIGNVISPQNIVSDLGADILRLWVASTDYSNEITVSNDIFKRSIDVYRRIRNTARFLLANLSDFNPIVHIVRPDNMIVLDQWAVSRAWAAQSDIVSFYKKYTFNRIVQRIMYFCSVEMGSFYLDIIKDRQYTFHRDSTARRSCQTAMYHIIEALVRWIAPITSFTADEIWDFIPGKREPCIFTEEWYGDLFSLSPDQTMCNNYWQTLLRVREAINKAIEKERAKKRIGSSLELSITLYARPSLAKILRALGNELRFVLLTSHTIVSDYCANDDKNCETVQQTGLEDLKIALYKAEGRKCPRCWHYVVDTDQSNCYNEICSRCVTNTIGSGENRKFV